MKNRVRKLVKKDNSKAISALRKKRKESNSGDQAVLDQGYGGDAGTQ